MMKFLHPRYVSAIIDWYLRSAQLQAFICATATPLYYPDLPTQPLSCAIEILPYVRSGVHAEINATSYTACFVPFGQLLYI